MFIKKRRKKSSILLFGLAIILLISVLGAFFLDIVALYETNNRVNQVSEEVARVRAQAVDVILKESGRKLEDGEKKSKELNYEVYETVVELLHPSTGYTENITHSDYELQGHQKPLDTNHGTYIMYHNAADEIAKRAGVRYLDAALNGNFSGQDILKGFSEANICIKIHPLPKDDKKITLSCTTDNGATVTVNDVKVSGISTNTRYIYKNDDTKIINKAKVVNLVFVGVAYDANHLIPQVFKQMGVDFSAKQLKSYSIAYPQLDKCFTSSEKNACDDVPNDSPF